MWIQRWVFPSNCSSRQKFVRQGTHEFLTETVCKGCCKYDPSFVSPLTSCLFFAWRETDSVMVIATPLTVKEFIIIRNLIILFFIWQKIIWEGAAALKTQLSYRSKSIFFWRVLCDMWLKLCYFVIEPIDLNTQMRSITYNYFYYETSSFKYVAVKFAFNITYWSWKKVKHFFSVYPY